LPLLGLRVRCSTGTYVRALARDLGETLGVGAHLVGLRRTAVGAFGVETAIGLDDLDDAEVVSRAAIEPLDALAHLPSFVADDTEAIRLRQGRAVDVVDGALEGLVAVAHGGELLAVGESAGGVLRPRKVFGT
jgi:tRNA pseudouridine55 synthase